MARILMFDDDRDCLTILSTFLKLGNHEPYPLLRAEQMVQAVEEVNPGLVITDLMMPGMTGGYVYHGIRAKFGPHLPIIVSSGSNLRLKLPDDPLLDYCPKPVDMGQLLETVNKLLKDADSRRAAAE